MCIRDRGKVLEVQPKAGKVIVEKVNVVSRHTKPRKQGDQGGILKKEAPIYAVSYTHLQVHGQP